MKELSLNILDIAENSVKAKADKVEIKIEEDGEILKFSISDNGCGMKPDFLKRVVDPFATTRTTDNCNNFTFFHYRDCFFFTHCKEKTGCSFAGIGVADISIIAGGDTTIVHCPLSIVH